MARDAFVSDFLILVATPWAAEQQKMGTAGDKFFSCDSFVFAHFLRGKVSRGWL